MRRMPSVTVIKVNGSSTATWKSWLANIRVIAMVPTNPITVPANANRKPWVRINRIRSTSCAPSATRTPISRVRWLTEKETTPYIPSAEIATLEPEVRDFDPALALDGGADGLDFYRRLATDAPAFLKVGGRLILELGDGQAADVSGLLGEHGWAVDAVEKDYSGRERILIARRGD